MGDVKIQLNSLAALERLIGGDSELEVEIRNNIVQEFTKRYLKQLVDGRLQLVEADLKGYISKQMADRFGQWNYRGNLWGHRDFELNKETKQTIEEHCQKLLFDQVEEVCRRVMVGDFDKLIQHKVDKQITKEFNRMVEEAVQKRLREVTERLQNALDSPAGG